MKMTQKWKKALALTLACMMFSGCAGLGGESSEEVSTSTDISSEYSEEMSSEEISSEETSSEVSSENSSFDTSSETSSDFVWPETSSSAEPAELTYWTDTEHYGINVTSSGDMMLGEEKLYMAGVNCYNLFNQIFANNFQAQRAKDTLDALAAQDVKVVRFNCGVYSDEEFSKFTDNQPTYILRLRQISDYAAQKEIGLIPCFFWTTHAVPDHFDEPIGHWGHPNSKTIAFMKEYVGAIVEGLKNDKAIFAWEFGNEFNLDCDIPNALNYMPPLPAGSSRLQRTQEDCLSAPDVQYAYQQFVATIRAKDPNRMITSGNSTLRAAQYNLYHNNGSWAQDTKAQYKEMTAMFTPDGMTAVGEHAYYDNIDDKDANINNLCFKRFGTTMTMAEYLTMAMQTAKSLGKAYYIGEWGGTKVQQDYAAIGNTLVDCGVQLALLWNYNLEEGTVEGSFSANTSQGQQLLTIVKNMNARYASKY